MPDNSIRAYQLNFVYLARPGISFLSAFLVCNFLRERFLFAELIPLFAAVALPVYFCLGMLARYVDRLAVFLPPCENGRKILEFIDENREGFLYVCECGDTYLLVARHWNDRPQYFYRLNKNQIRYPYMVKRRFRPWLPDRRKTGKNEFQ